MSVDTKKLLPLVVGIARNAGVAIMRVYEQADFGIETKTGDPSFLSPLTKADTASNKVIEEGLKKITDYPILSEEGNQDVANAKVFWLIDPLDGTKEFIKKNGEFTINIALIENEEPTLGVVYAPVKGVLYAATKNEAYKKVENGEEQRIQSEYKGDVPGVVVSRSHRDSQTEAFLEELGEHEEISMGSSLKLCLVAEGRASHYPRLAPTFTWDTAAADAVVRAAGGTTKDLHGNLLHYPPVAQRNPSFVCCSKNTIAP